MQSQSCITAIGFPENMEDLIAMANSNLDDIGRWDSDLECLLNESLRSLERNSPQGFWTAPKWMTEGDILFFYQTSFRPKWFIRRLQRQVDDWPEVKQSLSDCLGRNLVLIDRYKGSIFACARVLGTSEDRGNEGDRHFRGRIFAPYGEVNLFVNPLAGDSLKKCVALARGGTITPLLGEDFEKVRSELSMGNILPDYLAFATSGGISFRNVDRTNWRHVSCSPNQRFIDEAQVRSYLLDFFLGEIKDTKTQLLEECDCYRHGIHTGVADYFVKINGRWIPVEAKLNSLCEPDIMGQIQKYISIQMISPRKGGVRGERLDLPSSELCILVDQHGLYVTNRGHFVAGEPGSPAWTREELGRISAAEIRFKIDSCFDK